MKLSDATHLEVSLSICLRWQSNLKKECKLSINVSSYQKKKILFCSSDWIKQFLEDSVPQFPTHPELNWYKPMLDEKMISREFPGGPVVRTLRSHCWGPGVQSLVGELKSHKLHGAAKKRWSLKEGMCKINASFSHAYQLDTEAASNHFGCEAEHT